MKKAILIVVVALLLGTPVLAQPRPVDERPERPERSVLDGKFWKMPRIQEELGLTEEQVAELDRVFVEAQRELIDLKAEAEKAKLDMDSILHDHEADSAEITRRIERLEDARAELGKARALMLVKVRDVLTPEQRRKVEKIRELEQRRRMERRDQMRDRRDRRDRPMGPPPGGHGQQPRPRGHR